MTSDPSPSLVPPDPSEASTLVSEEPSSAPNIKQDSGELMFDATYSRFKPVIWGFCIDVPAASTSKLPSNQEANPWMTSVTNVKFKDMSSSIFNFGPTPWPGIKGKSVDKASISSALSTSPLGGGGIPSVVLAPAPPLGQHVSLGTVSLDPQPDPEELKIDYKCGGHPRTENLENDDECEIRFAFFVNDSFLIRNVEFPLGLKEFSMSMVVYTIVTSFSGLRRTCRHNLTRLRGSNKYRMRFTRCCESLSGLRCMLSSNQMGQ